MSLISLIITLAIVGFLVWLITTYIPMPAPFKNVIYVVVTVVPVLWLIQVLGVTGPMLPRLGR